MDEIEQAIRELAAAGDECTRAERSVSEAMRVSEEASKKLHAARLHLDKVVHEKARSFAVEPTPAIEAAR